MERIVQYNTLGKTGLRVSDVGFGAWAIGGMDWGSRAQDEDAVAALNVSLERGVNFFDTCDAYGDGHSEELIGECFRGRRHDVIIATKGGTNFRIPERSRNFNPDYIMMCVDESLRRLQTDYIDLYLLHVPVLEWQQKTDIYATLKAVKQSGKARHVGLAMWRAADTVHALEHDTDGVIEALECPFNILNKTNVEVIRMASERGIGVFTSEPLAAGILTGKYSASSQFAAGDHRAKFWTPERFASLEPDMDVIRSCVREPVENMTQLALAYILNVPGISCVIPGCKNARQALDNISASGLRLDEDSMRILRSTNGFIYQ